MKNQKLIEQLKLEEKAALLTGKNMWQTREVKRLGIESIFCADGPHGIRKQMGSGDHLGLNASVEATCFPTAATMANSWNPELGERVGKASGEEAAAQDVDVLLGPGLNIKRNPLCGRNFEYFSEDPYLAGKMAAAYIRGIQSEGVYACPKHFAVNSQELRRMAMNAVIDERTLRELYLTGFEIAIKEGGAKAIMSSYNQVNGTYVNENTHLLQRILREDWGFDGVVITDWGGSNDHVAGVKAGSGLEMPSCGFESARELLEELKKPVGEKRLTEDELDQCLDTLLSAVTDLNQKKKTRKKSADYKAHHQLAMEASAESIVLLKNQDHILPLKKGLKTALIGDFAFTPRYQGAGSSVVNSMEVENLSGIFKDSDINCIGMTRGYTRTGEDNEELRRAALDLAAEADVVIYCFGLNEINEAEGLDRNHMRLPQNQIALLEDLYHVNDNIVGVLSAGSAIELPWHYNCKAIVHGYLCGEAGASAMAGVLTGAVNPSGRLNETYPLKYEDTPSHRYFPSTEKNSEYRESIYIGYRYYDTSKVRVLYPFGYGLSYTEFAYSELIASKEGITFTLKNVGTVAGSEVAQVYIGMQNGQVFRPDKELKGFSKIFLQPGEEKRVFIPFDEYTFRYWNTDTDAFETESGIYDIMVGSNVANILLTTELHITGTNAKSPYTREELPGYFSGLVQNISEKEYEKLLGYKIPSGKWSGVLTENDAICQMYYAKSRLARKVYKILTNMKNKSEDKGKPDLNILFIYNMPFRGIAKMTGGAVSMSMVRSMLLIVNGHFWKGLGGVIGGFFRNKRENSRYRKLL